MELMAMMTLLCNYIIRTLVLYALLDLLVYQDLQDRREILDHKAHQDHQDLTELQVFLVQKDP
ncbi:unnamed protein product [Strongylus vulgaris]|uniref:Uncharacterized protein n=1 Tax=Strongylus vulgaris TaxID=40348 RepID=A0A3P7IKE2_STRVU|nr:unnamed protein product [Strongylus vulgaris]